MTPEGGVFHSCMPECNTCKLVRLEEANKYMQKVMNGFPAAIRAAQAEQRRKDAETVRQMKGCGSVSTPADDWCEQRILEIASTIEAQEEP